MSVIKRIILTGLFLLGTLPIFAQKDSEPVKLKDDCCGSVSGAEVLESDWYWSSSEDYDYPAYNALYVSVDSGSVNGDSKGSRLSYVRPVLAF